MKHCKKLFSGLLTIGFLSTLGITAGHQNARFNAANAASGQDTEESYSEADFADETLVDEAELTVGITQSTTTATSQAIVLNFRSRTSVGFQPAKQNYIAQINDENFTGDQNKPAPEGYDRTYTYFELNEEGEEEEKVVPLFDGMITYVTGAKDTAGKRIYIPSYFVKRGKFAIAIVTICTNATTEDGVEYNPSGSAKGKNCWTNANNSSRITDIYIPDTVTTVESEAFTGVPDYVNLHVEGNSLPIGFADDWTDALDSQIEISDDCYVDTSGEPVSKEAYAGPVNVTDLAESTNFILGYKQNEFYPGEEYDKPLVAQYDIVKFVEGGEQRRTVYERLEVLSNKNSYDGVGDIGTTSFSRTIDIELEKDETIDDESVIIHNIYKIIDDEEHNTYTIDLNNHFYAVPSIDYSLKIDIEDLVSFEESGNGKFCGFSRFSLLMSKNLSHVSEAYPEPHSYYLDLKTNIYEQNRESINSGKTSIRYSLYNLYKASYHFVYEGSGGEIKDIIVPIDISSGITYQVLNKDNGNVVACVLQDSAVASDFSADKVIKFEIKDLTVQMDLFTTSSSGSTSILGKSAIAYTFAYVTVFDRGDTTKSAFNFNLFVLLFFIGFVAGYAILAFIMFKVMKERYKNDEFRRVNNKKFLKSAVIGGIGSVIFALAVLFIIIRFSGFYNSIVTFNPADPFVIAFAIAGLVAFGYFVVVMVKMIKAEKERRKSIRLRLDEDVVDDGTN